MKKDGLYLMKNKKNDELLRNRGWVIVHFPRHFLPDKQHAMCELNFNRSWSAYCISNASIQKPERRERQP